MPVVDRQPFAGGVDACRRDVPGGGVDAGDPRTAARERFAQQTRAAADVDDPESGERRGTGPAEAPAIRAPM